MWKYHRQFSFTLLLIGAIPVIPVTNLAAASDPEAGENEVPGIVVHQLPVPSTWQSLTRQGVYTASPSIAVMPDGAYLLTCNHFGHGSGAAQSGTTFVYRSDDRGETWSHLTTLTDMKRGSLFVHPDGTLYLLGFRASPGDILIRHSLDGGHSWSVPLDETTGLLRQGSFGGTPNRAVIHDGRVWFAIGGTRFISAPVDADWLRAQSWTLSNAPRLTHSPIDGDLVITEAQVVASESMGPVLMPKVGGHPYTVLLQAGSSPETVRNPASEDWVQLPGGEKKFAASWDEVSGYFIALTNPVLPPYADSGWPPELIRNAGALLISKDLRKWEMVCIFLESPHVDYEAFQYFSFDFDGDDLVIASRTALHMGERKPPRGHDSNLITFHRINNFRELLQNISISTNGGFD